MILGKEKAWIGAIVSGVLAFLGAILVGLQAAPEGAGLDDLSAAVWVSAIIAGITALGLTGGVVYAQPNHTGAVDEG